MNNLLCFGMGFSAQALARRPELAGWNVLGTARTTEGVSRLQGAGFQACLFDDTLSKATAMSGPLHLLLSAPPSAEGDPVLARFGSGLAALASRIAWVGYLSTTGVYGDHAGGWVDEDTPLAPRSDRARRRAEAEAAWLAWGKAHGVAVQVFRLAGIYGPGRNQLEGMRAGTARRIDKPGQVFSRIHVDDIANVLSASIAKPRPGRVYNVCDDEPCAPEIVVAFAARLLGLSPPPLEKYADVRDTLSPMAASFYDESKRVRNSRMKDELGVKLQYPTYREGLRSLLAGAIG
jgi:nucleoside-diphosphate-sugar epimerase